MKRNVSRVLLAAAAAAVLLAASPALAQHGGRPRHFVPEFDPASVGAVVALLIGGGVLAARRRRP